MNPTNLITSSITPRVTSNNYIKKSASNYIQNITQNATNYISKSGDLYKKKPVHQQYLANWLAVLRGQAKSMEEKLHIEKLMKKCPRPTDEALSKSGMSYFDIVRVFGKY